MKTNFRKCLSAALALTCLGAAHVTTCKAENTYRLLKEIPVGGEGGWDYLSVDEPARRLYVSHASKVVVIELDKETVVGEIANTLGVHGVALAPNLHRAFVSDGREAKASIVDTMTLQTISTVDTGENPDAILFEPARQEVYAFNGRGKSATVFGAKSGEVVATVPLGGKPEFAQVDAPAGRVFVNLDDKNEVAVIDTRTHTVVARWPIAPGEEASGMAFDAAHRRLILGCHNRLMVMMDSATGKVIATAPIGEGVDANAFDPATQFAFASCGDGTTTIAHEDTPDKLTIAQTLKTERGARTMTIDPKTHNIYLASARFEAPAEGQRRGKIVAGSFKILVYGLDKAPAAK